MKFLRLFLITMLALHGQAFASIIDSGPFFTTGSVIFAGAGLGPLTQDNTNFFWDDTNNRLGIDVNTPAFPLDVNGTAQFKAEILKGATSGTITRTPPATVTTYATVTPSAQGAANTSETNDGSGNLTWKVPTLAFTEVSATAAATITTTAAVITTMTTTPAAGIYLVQFSGNVSSGSAGGAVLTYYITLAGTQQAASVRTLEPFSSAALAVFQAATATTNGIITVNGSQAIAITASSSNGNFTMTGRTLDVVRIQ